MPSKHKAGKWHTDGKRVEVVTSYLVLGKAPLVEAITGVPVGTIRRWKTEPWWNDLVAQIQTEDNQELDAKLGARLSKALDIVSDRLDSGDFMYDPKSGEFKRRPVSMKDTWHVAKEMVDIRQLLRRQPAEKPNQEAVSDILKNLANEFADMARKRLREKIVDGEVLNNAEQCELCPGLQTGVQNGESETKTLPTITATSTVSVDENRPST